MNNLLLLWLSLSLSGSLVAVTLVLLKPLLRRFSKTWQYYLWLLVILRLLVPLNPNASVMGDVFEQAAARFTVQAGTMKTAPGGKPPEDTQPQDAPGFENTGPQRPSAAIHGFSFLRNHAWGALWLMVALLLLVRKTVGYGRFLHTVKKESVVITGGRLSAALQTAGTEMGIRKKISVYINPFLRAPMLIGFFKPVIVLPNENIPASELTLILRHELTHYRRMDLFYKWLAEIAVCLHWFNPVAYWVRRQINRDCEFSCDETVVSDLMAADRKAYGETLLNSIIINSSRGPDGVSLSLNKDGKLLKERLHAIMQYHRKSKRTVFTAAVLTFVLLCGSVYAGAYTAFAKNGAASGAGNIRTQNVTGSTQTVVYDHVEIRHNDSKDKFAYITNVRTNNTDQKIVSCDRAMLAFDKEGNPLQLDWWSRDGGYLSYHYLCLHGGLTREVLPGRKDDQSRGWKLNATVDPQVQKAAYVLFCDVEITFEDGTVWANPDYEKWRSTYEGQKVDVDSLEGYYPFEEKITF